MNHMNIEIEFEQEAQVNLAGVAMAVGHRTDHYISVMAWTSTVQAIRHPLCCNQELVVKVFTGRKKNNRGQARPTPLRGSAIPGSVHSSMYHSSMECMNTMPISSTRPLGTFLMRTEVLVG